MKEVNPGFKPACLMLQLSDTVKYRYERILWSHQNYAS
jgi:hypothetical protein